MPSTTTLAPPQAYLPRLRRFCRVVFRKPPRHAVTAPRASLGGPLLFTHHDIVALVEPFSLGGYALDLASSDRLQRRLVFRIVPRPSRPTPGTVTAAACVAPPLSMPQTLQLDSPSLGYFRLTRTLREAGGLEARLQAEGAQPADLLRSLQAVEPARHFSVGPGFRMARSGRVEVDQAGHARFLMTQAVVQTDALTLTANVSASTAAVVSSASVEIQARGPGYALPADLLAVLGWDWSLLESGSNGWRASVRVRGKPGARGEDAERKLIVAAAHLAQTLAEPPHRFHERLHTARFRVLARQAIPVVACALLAFEALLAGALREARDSALTLGLVCIPPALLLLFMLRSESPRLALLTWPRTLLAHAWRNGE